MIKLHNYIKDKYGSEALQQLNLWEKGVQKIVTIEIIGYLL